MHVHPPSAAFLSESVNLIIAISARRYVTSTTSPYLRTRNVTSASSSAGLRGARNVSGIMSARFEDFACIKPLFRPRCMVTMFIGCGLRERAPLARPLRIRCTRKGTSFFCLSLRRASDVRRRFPPARAAIHPTIRGNSRIPTARTTGRSLLNIARVSERKCTIALFRDRDAQGSIMRRNEEAISMFITRE